MLLAARTALGSTRTGLLVARTRLSVTRTTLRARRATLRLPQQGAGGWKSVVDRMRATLKNPRNPMNRDQFNRTEMCNTVSAYLARNKSIWDAIKAMGDTVDELDANNTAIAEKGRKQQTPITGAAEEKEQVRLDFEEKILELADQLSALAEKKRDANLAAQSELTLSALDKLADDELEETGGRISALAAANQAALADYAITPADVTALSELKTKFHAVKNAPRTAIAGRAGETNTLPGLISSNTSLLRNRLDKQMTKFRKSSPEFYAGYRSARVIVDRGGGTTPGQPAPTPPPAPPK